MSRSTELEIQAVMQSLEFNDFSWVELKQPLNHALYEDWLEKQYQGEMSYLSRDRQVRKNPSQHFEKMNSIILATMNYFPHPESQSSVMESLKIAHYARGKDYHFWFREKLQQAIAQLQNRFPGEHFLAFTDAVPLLERDHAYQAGLGWVGKNTCLIQRKNGSLFFIGEILSSLQNSEASPKITPDHCGTCTACLEACPTGAFVEPRVMDATKCISYWNIESKEVPPEPLREKMGDWFFGCDICQTVCPWNVKLHKMKEDFLQSAPTSDTQLIEDLKYILNSSNKKLMRHFKDTPLTRAGGRGLKRNALIVIGNKKLKALEPEVRKYLHHEVLGELAHWTQDCLVTHS